MKLKEGEKILQKYGEDSSFLQIVDDISLKFRIQSLNTPTQWYNVNLQSDYCDCPDWTSQCKHLYGIRLIIMQYFSHLSAILPILDNAHHMLDSGSHVMLDKQIQEEDVFEHLQDIKSMLFSIEQDVSRKSDAEVNAIMQQLQEVRSILRPLVSPNYIEMPSKGSIRHIQAHVTQTRLGHGKRPATNEDQHSACLMGEIVQPQKPTHQTGILRKKHQRGQNRVRFHSQPRIWCPHCCTKTLLVDPSTTIICHTCHAMLPLTKRLCPNEAIAKLVGKDVYVCEESDSFCCKIISYECGHSERNEFIFTLGKTDTNEQLKVQASHVRILMMYTGQNPIQLKLF